MRFSSKELQYSGLKRIGALTFAILLGAFAYGQISSLNQILDLTFEKSPNVKISKLSVDYQRGRVTSSQGQFNPILNAGINKSFDRIPNNIAIREGYLGYRPNQFYDADLFDYNVSVSKRFQTGTVIRPSIELNNFGKDALFDNLANAGFGEFITSRSDVFFDVTQPLLQGRGKKFYGSTIEIEQLNLSAAEMDYVFDVSNQIYLVVLNYLNVVSAKRDLEIQKSIEKNFQDFAEQFRLLSEKDVIPKAELTFINANVTSQAAVVKRSETDYNRAKNRLVESMGLLNSEKGNVEFDELKFGVDSLMEEIDDAYLANWLEKAKTTRGDYLASQKRVASKSRDIEFAQQQNQPRLDLTMGMGYHGIYETTSAAQFYAPIYSNIPGVSYRAGLVFSWPMGQKSTKGYLESSLAQKQTNEENMRRLALNIEQQLSSSFTDIVNYSEAVKQSTRAVEYNFQARANEYIKLQLGSSTVVNLVQVQNNYAFAQTSLNRYLLALNSAIIQFRYESGNLVKFTEDKKIVVDIEEVFTLPKITAQNE